MGLALNDTKTRIRLRETYADALESRDKARNELVDEAAIDLALLMTGGYDDDFDTEPDPNDVKVTAARKVVLDWYSIQRLLEKKSQEEQAKASVLSDLLRWALPMLQTQPTDAGVLKACGLMLRTDQTLTPLVAKYLGKATSDPETIVDWFEGFLAKDPYLTHWQAWWVAPTLGGLDASFADGSKQRDWLTEVWADPRCPEPVRAGLSWTMATKGLLSADELLGEYDRMTETGRPYLARALGAVAPEDPGAVTLKSEDSWVKWAFELGAPYA